MDLSHLLGRKFGKLEVTKASGLSRIVIDARCDCGRIIRTDLVSLEQGLTLSCPQCKSEPKPKPKRKRVDYSTLIWPGKKFGLLTVIEKVIRKKKGKNVTRWKCKCDCGNDHETEPYTLVAGQCRSCGCARFVSHKEEWINKEGKGLSKPSKRSGGQRLRCV
jgi:hypothetical protein